MLYFLSFDAYIYSFKKVYQGLGKVIS